MLKYSADARRGISVINFLLYAVACPSVCRLCFCNTRAPCSASWNFRQCFYAI